ncbi:hypothetical protein ACYZTX_29890 [Pseudomonas sp. MDT1-17]
MKQIIGAIIGAALGLGIGYWWLSPAQSDDQLRAAKLVSISESQQAAQAKDDAALKGICSGGSWKALPSGKVAVCAENVGWHLPTGPSDASQ